MDRPSRPVTILSTGGTIATAGERATPALDVAPTLGPERGGLAHATCGFAGAEGDLRASGGLPAASPSPQSARIVLLAGLAGGADRAALAHVLEPRS